MISGGLRTGQPIAFIGRDGSLLLGLERIRQAATVVCTSPCLLRAVRRELAMTMTGPTAATSWLKFSTFLARPASL